MSETKAEYVVSDKPADFVVTVCEWTAHAGYHVICWPSCKRDDPIVTIDIDNWKHCPYCGKPIQVTP